MFKGTTRKTIHISAALAALWLTACGGGGGGDETVAAAPSASAAPAPAATPAPPAATPAPPAAAPAPAPAPAPAANATILVTADTQAVANKSYGVNAAGAGPVTVTLPASASLAVGDTVTVSGVSAAAWQIAQNAGQTVLTGAIGGNPAITGNVLPGTAWAPSAMGPAMWHSVNTNPGGNVIVATDIVGTVHVSTDGGTTFTTSADLPSAPWIGTDMSADGQRIAAIAFGGDMYLSTNAGANWTRVTSATVPLTGRDYESITMSDDGRRIVAVIMDGPVVVSQDGGATWTTGTVSGAPLTASWRSVDSTADGLRLVAVSQAKLGVNGRVYTSADGGVTWTLRPVLVGGVVSAESGWYRSKMSRDGSTIAIAPNSIYAGGGGGTMHISTDGGATWAASGAPGGDYTGIAMSASGTVIGATLSNGTAGSVQYSTNRGAAFTALTLPSGADTNFRNIAMDSYGYQMAVVTGTFTTTNGQLYSSIGNRTRTGTTGSLGGGGQGETLKLRYDGSGVFSIVGSTGAFVPR